LHLQGLSIPRRIPDSRWMSGYVVIWDTVWVVVGSQGVKEPFRLAEA